MKRRVALVAAVTVAVLGLAELTLRAFDLPRFDACRIAPDYAVPDAELGFRGAPGGHVAGVRLNARGLRGPLLSSPRPPRERRILFLGDSTCWGLGVELDESFAARSAGALGASFVLGAFPGYSSYHSAIVLERLLDLEPTLVVLYVGARNDGDRARYFPDAQIPARQARLHAGWHDVRILRLVEVARDRAYHSLFRKLRSREARARVPPEAFRSNLTRMLRRLERAGVPALIVIPPLSRAFEADQPQMRRYREILAEVAPALGVPSVSVDARFADADPDRVYFEDGYHLKPAGHAIVAEEIAKHLTAR